MFEILNFPYLNHAIAIEIQQKYIFFVSCIYNAYLTDLSNNYFNLMTTRHSTAVVFLPSSSFYVFVFLILLSPASQRAMNSYFYFCG